MVHDCLVYPYHEGDGPTNMALDEALLEAVAADGTARLRTYGWTVPTLSLGYFQRIGEAEADPRWAGVPIVRRPTGGGAIWHHHELTYALAVPSQHPLARRSEDLYRAVHGAIAELLRGAGVDAGRRGAGGPEKIEGSRPLLCFTDRDAEDIVAWGWKVVGSAQRRRFGAVLQHGSMLLVRSAITPELPGACDLAPTTPDVRFWSRQFGTKIPESLGLRPSDAPSLAPLFRRAEELAAEVYRGEHWTRKR